MGVCFSSDANKSKKLANSEMPSKSRGSPQVVVDSPDKYDEHFIEILRREFRNDLQTFLLNHILMSVMFFENYERDINKLSLSVSEWEQCYNKRMISEYQKECLMPDVVFEHVSKNIRFRPFHGSQKHVSEPLAPQRLFIVHNNIEVPDPYDNSLYTKIDKPAYKGIIEESEEHKGYVKLRELDLSRKRSPPSLASDSEDSLYEMLPSSSKDQPSTSTSGVSVTDSEYDYTRITQFRTPQPLNIEESDIYTKVGTLPSKCLTQVKTKNRNFYEDENDDDDEEEDSYSIKKKTKSKLFVYKNYFNSKEFMSHFADRVFPNVLGKALEFTDEEMLSADAAECKIYCNTLGDDNQLIFCEIIPSIAIPWPDLAFEWSARKRPAVIDNRTLIRYQWPTEKMVREIKSLSCVIVPKGYMPKKNKEVNPFMQLEWEVCFPKAEKYLETKMSHAQMRCYLSLIAIYKTFIEPVTLNHGLLVEHIRTLMFWECERNYMSWTDCKLWKKLRGLLQTLDASLSRCQLPDYFVKNKNVFENVQKRFLATAQEAIFRILESPLPHVIRALRNLRCMSGKFYPTPDLKKLHDIIVTSSGQGNIPNDYLLVNDQNVNLYRKRRISGKTEDKDQEWQMRMLEKQRRERLRKLKMMQERREIENLNRRGSTDSIDMNMLEKSTVDEIKRRDILIFFIDHFLAVAKTSSKIGSARQTLFYLKQAWYLTRLLADTAANQEDVDYYEKIICKEEEMCQRKAEKVNDKGVSPNQSPPSPPRRNSSVNTTNNKRTSRVRSLSESEEKSRTLKRQCSSDSGKTNQGSVTTIIPEENDNSTVLKTQLIVEETVGNESGILQTLSSVEENNNVSKILKVEATIQETIELTNTFTANTISVPDRTKTVSFQKASPDEPDRSEVTEF